MSANGAALRSAQTTSGLTIVVIGRRALIRECLARALASLANECSVIDFPTATDWLETRADCPGAVVLLCAPDPDDAEVKRDLAQLARECVNVPIIIFADKEGAQQARAALESGAHGYIPTSMSLDVAVEAVRVVGAGGTFVPASAIISSRRHNEGPEPRQPRAGQITARQAAIVEAVRQGKANKQIAWELNLSEATVKVHLRNIMRKLNARNRTELAMLATHSPWVGPPYRP